MVKSRAREESDQIAGQGCSSRIQPLKTSLEPQQHIIPTNDEGRGKREGKKTQNQIMFESKDSDLRGMSFLLL